MAEFDDIRKRLQNAREQGDAAGNALFQTAEQIKRLEGRERKLNRIFDPENPEHIRERRRLAEERERLAGSRAEWEQASRDARASVADLVKNFGRFTDPREGIQQLEDSTPILFFPVRLETRFKTIAVAGASRRQLWVRIYPDDCLVDSFEPTLSKTEIESAQLYWTGIWEAGGIESQRRAAWRGLVASHGTGRAEWIVQSYQPLNIAGKPAKALDRDVILTIPTENPPSAAEQSALQIYWRAVWLADGDKAKQDAALAALEATPGVGPERAAELVALYQPINLPQQPPEGFTKQQVTVSTSFLVFQKTEDLVVMEASWSRAPKAALLPDRFAFMGFAGSTQPKVVIGGPVIAPLVVGPDPSLPETEQLRQDENGELIIPDEMQWMTDFDRAVAVGMGFRVDLNEAESSRGFDRVIVVGLRLSSDREKAKSELESLIEHHRLSRSGFSLVPQGTPTNNTEEVASGLSRGEEDADARFDDLEKDALFQGEPDWKQKKDGQWLAEYLGINPDVLKKVRHAGGSDQVDARAMNIALWPATMGHWMEEMMRPVFSEGTIESLRDFFNDHVLGRGGIPAIRIGSQPYGILPVTALSDIRWFDPAGLPTTSVLLPQAGNPFFLRLYQVLKLLDEDWRRMSAEVEFTGKPGDPHKILLDILGLHPDSVEFWQRYAESVKQLYNRLNLQGLGGFITAIVLGALQQASVQLLANFGYSGDPPEILNKFFFGNQNLLKGPVVDDQPLSETEPIRDYTTDGRNYLEWLIDAARTSVQALYNQEGFIDDKRPRALLYLMLRHALQLGYSDVSIRLNQNAGILSVEQARLARRDEPFINIRPQATLGESRYTLLLKPEPVITGSQTLFVDEYIGQSIAVLPFARYLNQQVAAMERLKNASTARLERAFVEHIDCCSYRLDAWLLGLVHRQLAIVRNIRDRQPTEPRQGIYIGAYAWLEDLRPERGRLTPFRPEDPGLADVFARSGDPQLMRDSANQGYVHAPSLNHAVTAAILRNGFTSSASPQNRQTMAVNLTSERARTALALIEGIRNGQSLGALLGYQFERGLHDSHNLAEVDKFIYKIRKVFPLSSDRLQSTKTPEGVSIEAIEARNVMDGLALVEHIKRTPANKDYPFGENLPAATPSEASAINAQVDRLLDAHDAVADLALAEGVYQAVLGNYDRVASTYDAYAKGNFPPEPQVVRTPTNGTGLTHRVVLHLDAAADPNASPIGGIAVTPRSQAEPAINVWLESVLPPPGNVGCMVEFRNAATNTVVTEPVTLEDLGIQPVDLVAIIRDETRQEMTELDDRVVRFVVANHPVRPDTLVSIRYMESGAPFSIFELMPLVRHLRRLLLSRPLRASDAIIGQEATEKEDVQGEIDKQRLVDVRGVLNTLRNDLTAFEALGTDADAHAQAITNLLARAALFAIPQSGWGFVQDFRRRVFNAVLKKSADLVARWNGRLAEYDALIVEYNALPPATADPDKFELLGRAELLISNVPTSPLPASPDTFRDDLENVKRPAFMAKRDQFAAVAGTNRTAVMPLLADVNALLPVSDFDATPFDFQAEQDEAQRFIEDAISASKVVLAEADRRLATSLDLFNEHDSAAELSARVKALQAAVKALLGEDFLILPRFTLAGKTADEFKNAHDAGESKAVLTYLTGTVKTDFPVDTWLYGAARTREKLRAWEQVVMHAGALGRAEPELFPLQFPFTPGDQWLALEFPPEEKLETDHLLYTAAFATPFAKTAPQCGLLMDEWNEVIPAADVTTGLTFHYDRPNSEPPQSILLALPSRFTGRWQWDDLVKALNETLDFAKRRAVEPVHIEKEVHARFLPATVMAVTVSQLTISANLALNSSAILQRSS